MDHDARRPDGHLLHGDTTHAIIGGFFAVHTALGSGSLESVYANALAAQLQIAEMKVEREARFTVDYRGRTVGVFKADMVVADKVIVETKAARLIDPVHVAQLYNYLRVSGLEVGLLLNFGPRPEFERMIATRGGAPVVTSVAALDRPAERSSTGTVAPAG